jgi:7,8-dihydropterin-6-yl-methyl-4-(beta-D-ribofuranosyl)aminobenzene 5'-phosphate synthase
VKITCIVDDRAPAGAGLKAEHGASFLIESEDQGVLFDTGQSAAVLLQNLDALGFDPARIDALVISHGHDDHTGGLPALLDHAPGIPLHAHPDLFRPRFRKTDTGPRHVGPALDREALAAVLDLRLSAEPSEVIPGVWTSGEIVRRPEPEGRSPYHVVRDGHAWRADPYGDDLSVVLKTGSGLVLVCGCCHAGLLNTLAHVRRTFGQDPVAVLGGTHLVNADTPTMERVVDQLQGYGPPSLWLGHCTGQRGFLILKAAFGDAVGLFQVGSAITF